MPTEHVAEMDPDEIEYSKHVVKLLKRVDEISGELNKHVDAPGGSKLALDDSRSPYYPVSSYGYVQLLVAVGCLESLGQMILREDEKSIELTAGPYGSYALVRNALDCAATALWLLEPHSSTLRIKRRVMLEVDETRNAAALRESTGERGRQDKLARRWERLREVVGLAELADWDPLSKSTRLPRMTDILKAIERHHHEHDGVVMPWLAAWQLASGHAHGKVWAQIASHQMDEIADTRTETGATFRVTIKFGMLAALLFETVQLIESATARYVALLRAA
ncbi:hypothetical protein [Arthrobacter sp. D2-10]